MVNLSLITKDDVKNVVLECLDEKLKTLKQTTSLSSPKPWLTIKEVCELLSISRGTLYDWINKGILKAYKKGNRSYFSYKEIEQDLLNSNL